MTYLYPTASTTAIFLNGFHVEQAYQIQYKESFNKIPIYGYADYTYSKVAYSRKMVQGLVVLNFIFPGYLNSILDKNYSPNEDPYVPKLYNFGFSKEGETQKNRLIQDIKNKIRTELPPNSTTDEKKARAEYIASLISKDPSTKEATKAALVETFTTQDDGTQFSELESPISLINRDDLILDVYYQDPALSTWFVRFTNVHFYETSQIISQAGAEGSSDPLYEIYPWIAKERKIKLIKSL